MIDINFSILCTINISHEYYGDNPWYDFTIVPSQQTLELLGNCRIIYRQQANQFIVGIQSVVIDASVSPPVTAPFIIPPADQPLTFFIQCNNPVFSNFTNIPLNGLYGKLFYFTNRNNNVLTIGSDSTFYISNTIPSYDNTIDYNSGDTVISGGKYYTAIQSKLSANLVDPPDLVHWREIDESKKRYVSQNDLLQWMPPISNYLLSPPQNSVTYKVNAHDNTVSIPQTTINFQQPTDSFKLDLSPLAPGKYDLIVNGQHNNIYLNNELTGTAAYCGVIELYNESTLPAAYSYFDNNGNLFSTGKMFSISFLNRATIWKYILKSTSQGTITMGGFNFPASAGNPIFSLSPIPLSEIPPTASLSGSGINEQLQTVSFTNQSVSRAFANRLSKNTNDLTDTHYYSEIYLNY